MNNILSYSQLRPTYWSAIYNLSVAEFSTTLSIPPGRSLSFSLALASQVVSQMFETKITTCLQQLQPQPLALAGSHIPLTHSFIRNLNSDGFYLQSSGRSPVTFTSNHLTVRSINAPGRATIRNTIIIAIGNHLSSLLLPVTKGNSGSKSLYPFKNSFLTHSHTKRNQFQSLGRFAITFTCNHLIVWSL